jgi:hypothetical protein
MADIDEVIRLVQERVPLVEWEQLSVKHPADDDNLWYFWVPGQMGEVQIEADGGRCPVLVETDKHDERVVASSPVEVAKVIVAWLELPDGRAREDV